MQTSEAIEKSSSNDFCYSSLERGHGTPSRTPISFTSGVAAANPNGLRVEKEKHDDRRRKVNSINECEPPLLDPQPGCGRDLTCKHDGVISDKAQSTLVSAPFCMRGTCCMPICSEPAAGGTVQGAIKDRPSSF